MQITAHSLLYVHVHLQANEWSLEDLELYLDIGAAAASSGGEASSHHAPSAGQDSIVAGLMLEGARYVAGDGVQLSDQLRSKLPDSHLRWRLKTDAAARATSATTYVELPLYLNSSRTSLLADVLLAVPSSVPRHVWAQRGVGIIMQSPSL